MPTFSQDLDIWQLILHASILVKVVMAIIVVVSFMSWMFIFQKWFVLRRAVKQTLDFEREFWGGKDLNALYQGAVNNRHSIGSLERVFEAGYREFAKLRSQAGTDVNTMVDGARRAMRATFQREMDYLERHLAFLASTGSVSPYVGLFGTVWGIMHAFRSLANVQQATLAQGAPGIAGGLVAPPGERPAGRARAGRPRHRRGAGRHRDRSVRGDSGGDRVQPLLARHRAAR